MQAFIWFLILTLSFAEAQAEDQSLAEQKKERVILSQAVTPVHYDIVFEPDPKTLRFSAEVIIDIDVAQKTDKITLNAADLQIDFAVLDSISAEKITTDTALERLTVHLKKQIGEGRHKLRIGYRGKIYRQASGLFALDYIKADGQKGRSLFTQFEAADARRFVPSWDEPNRKASFTLSAIVPANQMAVSNMPIETEKRLVNGKRHVRFAVSPKMSTYLLFFCMGEFERIATKVQGVDLGVVVRRGAADQARGALKAAKEIIPWFSDYFGISYPLPKLDMIAAPGSSQFFGAMENWGAILYFERRILIDPKISTTKDLQRVYLTVAHEIAHQWFGNLVTMDWWDDLWLNEGFATWMETKVTDHFNPQWNVWLQQLDGREHAMKIDSGAGSHAIIPKIYDVSETSGTFSPITYEKGAAVIRMLESYVGPERFRKAVRNYMKAHLYGNAVTDSLWEQLDRVTGEKISDIAHDMTRQKGVPLLVQDSYLQNRSKTKFTLTTLHFHADQEPDAKTHWKMPLLIRPVDKDAFWTIVDRGKLTSLEMINDDPIILNAGQKGYMRILYAPEAIEGLIKKIGNLKAVDQYGLLADTAALGYNGAQSLAVLIRMIEHLPRSADPLVWAQAARSLSYLSFLYKGQRGEVAFRAHGRRLLTPLLADLKWTRQPGEADNRSVMRNRIYNALAALGSQQVLDQAYRRFERFIAEPNRVPAEERNLLLDIVAPNANARQWAYLLQRARKAITAVERQDYYTRISQARDPMLARRALDLAFGDSVDPTVAPLMVATVAMRHPKLTMTMLNAHWAKFSNLLEPTSRLSWVPRIMEYGHSKEVYTQLQDFAKRNLTQQADSSLNRGLSEIQHKMNIRKKHLPKLSLWLQKNRAAY